MNYKNSIGILSVIIILLCGCQPDKKTIFTAASYNLRNANSADSLQGDGWGNRCPIIARLVQFHEFDIFGTQEGLRHQLDSLKTSLPKYDYIGVGRNDGKKEGEHAAIFYRIDKFELLEHGDFWLSETPEKPSVGWDAVLPRICTWGHFKYKDTGFEFLFFNLHMDHIGKQARVESALLVQQKMKEIGENLPAILTGDFNVDQTHRSYLALTESGILRDAPCVCNAYIPYSEIRRSHRQLSSYERRRSKSLGKRLSRRNLNQKLRISHTVRPFPRNGQVGSMR